MAGRVETFSIQEPSGLLQYRDANWVRNGATLTRRVDPTWNQMGAMTGFGYGTSGSLYSYAYTFDNAWRPVGMTGEGLALVSGVSYNAAGAVTGFTRDDGSGTPVNNVYGFNALYQMTNQTVTRGGTTLQNLTYAFSATQNNAQVLSQTDALSGETVEYAYDSLNRLATAQTTGPQWGLQFYYDGFGNRTNQTVTKGSGPTHSVAIDAATNRISTGGYLYDANGNMTQMPQLTMGYDVANRMVTSNHAGAGTQSYGYNQANQRVFVRNGATVTYYLYGLGGERLLEFAEACTGGGCTGYAETQRWIYFAGRKMFSKTGTTLKAITPSRLASEAKHFPYGETDGAPPSDTKDYFATYRRDGTGLDYAWNRYYSPTMGRFTTADPYGGSVSAGNPGSWNRYSYTENNPGNWIDPDGLNLQHLVPIADGGGWATDASLSGPWGPWGDWGPWWPPLPDSGQFWLPEPELPLALMPTDARGVKDWDDEIASLPGAIAERVRHTRNPQMPKFPLFLAVIDDCYKYGYGGLFWGRSRKYTLLDQTGLEWKQGFTVQEQITVTNGSLSPGSYPGRWSSSDGKYIEDFISKGNQARLTEHQQFIFIPDRGRGSLFSWLPFIPLVIVERDGRQHGTLTIDAVSSTVAINGDHGNVERCN